MATDREARLRAQKKYDEAHKGDYKTYIFKCNKIADRDIINHLETKANKQGYIKELIRRNMEDMA
jgi:hypothetical protein